MTQNKQLRFRMIIPAFPRNNIYTRIAKKTTSLGPVLVASAVKKFLPNWAVEIIDENNYHHGPLAADNKPDHTILQQEDPADVVGFYCGLTSTMLRVWELAQFYKQSGAITLAGSWHVKALPEESLEKNIDVVVIGDGEKAIIDILTKFENQKDIPSIITAENINLACDLPFPDFGILRFARMKLYPLGMIRGCSKKCEFCLVKDKPRWGTPEYLYDLMKWLVETRRANKFFLVDDRLEENREGYLKFFGLVAQKYGHSKELTAQARLEAIEDSELITAMVNAGVKNVCHGVESPIQAELNAMQKGLKVQKMLGYLKAWRKLFFVHAMFMWGYPLKTGVQISYSERIKTFKSFIRKGKPDTIQILRTVPLPGSELRERLEAENRLFPLNEVNWDKYDGNFVCFLPGPNDLSLIEIQKGPTKLMRWFYYSLAWVVFPWRTIMMPFDYIFRGWSQWYRGWRNDLAKIGANILLFKERQSEKKFIKFLRNKKKQNT
ncbi:MAG: cobalamin-dependent protein [bacterium]|nr:cobalamin-dependent protein [bacterium]